MSQLKMLIVEDDSTNRIVLQKMVTFLGSTNVAIDGEEAILLFKDAFESGEPYELIFLDIMMPKKDGRETLQEIRKIEEDNGIFEGDGVKIIMTTALGDSKTIFESFRQGCEAYILKPIKKDTLIEEIKKLNLNIED